MIFPSFPEIAALYVLVELLNIHNLRPSLANYSLLLLGSKLVNHAIIGRQTTPASGVLDVLSDGVNFVKFIFRRLL